MIIPKQPYLLHAEFTAEPVGNRGENLLASIRFGEGEQKIILGTIRYRISEIYLTLSCENCSLSSENWLFRGDLDRVVKVERTAQSNLTSFSEDTIEVGGEFSASAKLTGKELSRNSNGKGAILTQKMDHEIATVYAQGGNLSPKWKIRAPAHSNYLEGTLCEGEPFVRAELSGDAPGFIEASFRIPRSGITFQAENQISGQSPNKAGLLRHVIRLIVTERDFLSTRLEIGR